MPQGRQDVYLDPRRAGRQPGPQRTGDIYLDPRRAMPGRALPAPFRPEEGMARPVEPTPAELAQIEAEIQASRRENNESVEARRRLAEIIGGVPDGFGRAAEQAQEVIDQRRKGIGSQVGEASDVAATQIGRALAGGVRGGVRGVMGAVGQASDYRRDAMDRRAGYGKIKEAYPEGPGFMRSPVGRSLAYLLSAGQTAGPGQR